MKWLIRFGVFSLVLVLALSLAWVAGNRWLEGQLDSALQLPAAESGEESEQPDYYLDVPRGTSLARVLDRLQDDGVIDSIWPLKILARQEGRQGILAGEYRFRSGDTQRDLLSKLNRGDVIRYRITFAEGLSVREWLALLALDPHLEKQIAALDEAELLDLLDPELESLEGWLLPETYVFTRGDSDLTILRRAHQAMRVLLDRAWSQRAEGLPYETPYEALIMASIIEKETGVPAERPEIAGVFVRRLGLGMRLQTDPTVIYGLGERFDGNLRREHLREPNPYNTYRIPALPPTPIANPGRAAVEAALNPAPGDTLFFVARGDGSHHFSRTLDEHNRAVRKYQIEKRRADYRSSPPPVSQD